MGYIAPVPHYQYMQYQKRVANKGYDPFDLIPVEKTAPASQFGQILKDMQEDDESHAMQENTRIKHISSDLLYRSTGKGKFINEII
ncbi:hypothetical protein [Falsibacillus albus]|uniref:Uncharacterized protein n=1 Tax=Falsibacillus albus TaxID=2478915 RepID=A0A3L7K237_9BACI|nr:hypothetical protein [Falsibacillus albus]RLQ97157.1 hypothetical protein D9X91_03115 [Falsibacillus albus]